MRHPAPLGPALLLLLFLAARVQVGGLCPVFPTSPPPPLPDLQPATPRLLPGAALPSPVLPSALLFLGVPRHGLFRAAA